MFSVKSVMSSENGTSSRCGQWVVGATYVMGSVGHMAIITGGICGSGIHHIDDQIRLENLQKQQIGCKNLFLYNTNSRINKTYFQ